MTREAETVLGLIEDLTGLVDLEDLRPGMVTALRRAVPADFASVNEVRLDRSAAWSLVEPPVPERFHALFDELGASNPLVRHYAATRDGRALRFSDVCSADELHANELYQRVYRPLGIEHQIAFTLPASADRVAACALSRGAHDFTDRERAVLNRARPMLIQLYRNAVERHELLAASRMTERLRTVGLSGREAEVIAQIARGASAELAADRLGIGGRTIQTHLRHAYRKLGVRNRSAAAAAAWALAERAQVLD